MVSKLKGAAIGAAVGTGAVLIGIPLAVTSLGFTGSGIVAGSIAAKMMSAAAIANGGGVAAGSTVAVLQSIGAALGAKLSKGNKKPPDDDEESQNSDDEEGSDGTAGTG
ncbi:interferon alpha-inducible protein 27-like protein 2A isoform X2 [Melopsittacus undulatus]|uniref:interferon alpha-inducible protein 27-like protein 2A isoform X2 n=1 Tax=Melopsittacus undulatus TaxID=13146 RepID=UPI00146AFCA5|nr:interferon alpha-inducible protein 27-like protein 2A isoform X2 [Melopsittacus undulatus]